MKILKTIVLAAVAMPLWAMGAVTVNVRDNHDWWWTAPETPEITLSVVNDSCESVSCNVQLTVATDMKEPVSSMSQRVNVSKNDSTELLFGLQLTPGFYRCGVSVDGNEVKSFNIGYEPENIVSLPDSQCDFEQFWRAALDELSKVEPCYTVTEEKDKSNNTGRVYLVEMLSLGGDTIRGYLTVPRKCDKKHRFPVIVHYMGYGSTPWFAHPDSHPDFIEFVLSSRGQGLNKPGNKYGDWVVSGLESKDTYYYKGAFADLVRALDFVSQLPEADTRNIFAEGGSQGGAFTLAACALDSRIRAAAPWIPFLNDYPHYFKIVHWPAEPILKKQKELGMSDEQLYSILSYFDIKNHARNIKCPILMGVGLQDPVCPPHTNFAGYNLIPSPKRFVIYPHCGHDTEHPQWDNLQIEFFKENMIK
ncbi:MAG: acetylxylan esterase [Muribaculaceae bacterium]